MRLGPVIVLLLVLGACAQPISTETWEIYETRLKLEGKLRTDRIAKDVPFDGTDLADHFGKVAFGIDPEFEAGKAPEELAQTQMLRKWREPISYRVYGEPAGPDRRWIEGLFARLPGLTGIKVRQLADDDPSRPNFLVFFYDTKQRAALLAEYEDGEADAAHDALAELFSERTTCAGVATHAHFEDESSRGIIHFAMVFIRAELPDRLRTSCIEEEIVQSMGLIRDDDSVRPSIFNEDEEFAYLTIHDEYLLRILYDPRLSPGMTRDEAMPVVRQIAQELGLGS